MEKKFYLFSVERINTNVSVVFKFTLSGNFRFSLLSRNNLLLYNFQLFIMRYAIAEREMSRRTWR